MKKIIMVLAMFLIALPLFAGSKVSSTTTPALGAITVRIGSIVVETIVVDSVSNTGFTITISDGSTAKRVVSIISPYQEIDMYSQKFTTSVIVDLGVDTGTATVKGR